MQDIIRLFLVRTLSVALVILGATLLDSEFPTTPRQNGVLAFLTVGIPTVALAAWARPAQTPRRLVLSSAHFVIPAAIAIGAVCLLVYEAYLAVDDVTAARTAYTTAAILCGILLIPFAQPPNRYWAGGAEVNGDWKPMALAGVMLALYFVILAVDPIKDFYEMRYLSVFGYAFILLAVGAWAAGLLWFWRWNLPRQAKRFWQYMTAD
jgi:cation-transporting ATPase E